LFGKELVKRTAFLGFRKADRVNVVRGRGVFGIRGHTLKLLSLVTVEIVHLFGAALALVVKALVVAQIIQS